MIGFLSGFPKIIGTDLLVIAGGVGYDVHVGTSTLSKASGRTEIDLFIHTHVREEALELYGFLTNDDRQLFRLLLGVSGVGPRIALALADQGATSLSQAVQTADVSFFTSVPRVGKKLAQKIIIELKPKLGSLNELQLATPTGVDQDVVDAMQQLGFDEQLVLRQLQQLPETIDRSSAQPIIKYLLKQNAAR